MKKDKPAKSPSSSSEPTTPLHRRHLRVGWWALLLFLSLGLCLEAMHGFKVGWYLDVANETRRLMFTLAHTHGTLLALVNIGFAATVRSVEGAGSKLGSSCLMAATVLLPMGFLLGGLVIYAGDPGRGILLVPVGALLLLVAVLVTALRVTRA